jgi:hypothetical protein
VSDALAVAQLFQWLVNPDESLFRRRNNVGKGASRLAELICPDRRPPVAKVCPFSAYLSYTAQGYFYRNWTDYVGGFGDLDGEFWIGLDNLYRYVLPTPQTVPLEQPVSHSLTSNGTANNASLRLDLTDVSGNFKSASYSSFAVLDSGAGYQLRVSGYQSDAGRWMLPDDLSASSGARFSTPDVANDPGAAQCAVANQAPGW